MCGTIAEFPWNYHVTVIEFFSVVMGKCTTITRSCTPVGLLFSNDHQRHDIELNCVMENS